MQIATYADRVRPRTITNNILYDILIVIAATFLLSLSARIVVLIPFSPVPVTAQTLVVLLIGALLGRRRAVAVVILYLVEGMSGLPVFAGGNSGIVYLFGLTGGYLIGFMPAAYLCGYLAERKWDRHYLKVFILFGSGTAIIHLFGVGWLAMYISTDFALKAGFYPFIFGDILKICIAVALLSSAWRVTEKLKR